MTDFLKRTIQAYKDAGGTYPELTDDQIKMLADSMMEKIKGMQPIVTSCPHNTTLYQKGENFHCGWCGQIVHPDPESLKHGFLEYGRKRDEP